MDRRDETGEQDQRHHDDEGVDHRLLHVGRQCRDRQADADARGSEHQQTQIQVEQRTGHWDAEPEKTDGEDQGRLQEADEDRRHRLADEDFQRRQRSHQQLVEGALLTLPCDRERGQHQSLDHAKSRDQAWHDIPAGLQVRVEPGAHLQLHTWLPLAQIARVELADQAADVARRHAGGGGVATVQDQLQVAASLPGQALLEIGAHVQHEEGIAAIDDPGNIFHPPQGLHPLEDPGGVEAGEQFTGRCPVALVKHGVGHVVEVVGRAVAEQQRLHDRRRDEDHTVGGILDDGQELLATEVQQAADDRDEIGHGVSPASCVCIAAQRSAGIPRSRRG